MVELIAKRYIEALKKVTDSATFENVAELFECLANEYKNDKLRQILLNPSISRKEKSSLLIDSVKSVKSKEVENLLALLVEHGRIYLIPVIATEMQKEISRAKNSYTGKVFSDSEIDGSIVDKLAFGLHKKLDAVIALESVKNNYDGVKVEIEDLGIEINFSKTRLNGQLINHILKAI